MKGGIDTPRSQGRAFKCGNTVAVLGCGVDVVLAAELVAKGLLISEFPMGSVAFPQNSLIPNRVISGMSAGVLVGWKARSTAVRPLRRS